MKVKQIDLIKSLMQGEENERKRITEEINHKIYPKIKRIKHHLLELNTILKEEYHESFFDHILSLSKQLGESIQNISLNIIPKKLNESLEFILKEIVSNSDVNPSLINIELHTYGLENINIISGAKVNIVRSFMEALNNSLKHSKAKDIYIEAFCDSPMLKIKIEDNGVGFDTKTLTTKSKGLGLKNLKSRVQSMGGEVEFKSSVGNGTVIRLNFDLSILSA